MNSNTVPLLQFVILGVVIGTFAADHSPWLRKFLTWFIRPGSVVPSANGNDEENVFPRQEVIDNFLDLGHLTTVFWATVREFFLECANCGLTTTSNIDVDELVFQSASASTTPAYYRSLLLSTLRERGWTGLDDSSRDALSFLGAFRVPGNATTTHDQRLYVRRLIFYIILDALCRQLGTLYAPAVLNELVRSLMMDENHFDFETHFASAISSQPFGDAAIVNHIVLFLSPIVDIIVPIVLELIHSVETTPSIQDAFLFFAENPSSFRNYTYATLASQSVRQIVEETYAVQMGSNSSSFRTLSLVPRAMNQQRRASWLLFVSRALTAFGVPSRFPWGYQDSSGTTPRESDVDIEVGPILDGNELQYASALIVAALIRFHA